MKKLAIVYPAYYTESSGGAELQISYLSRALLQAGWEVSYIYVPHAPDLPASAPEKLYPLKPYAKRAQFFRYKQQIFEALERINPDIIYTRHSSSWLYYAASWARAHRIPHVHALASDHVVDMKFSLLNLHHPHRLFEETLVRRGMRICKNFITQNDFQQRKLKQIFRRDGFLVSQMTPFCADDQIVKNPEMLTVLWIANLKKLKQPEKFLHLVERIENEKLPVKCRFVMCGCATGVFLEMIQQAQKKLNTLQYLGNLSQEAVYRELASGDILVNTSKYEGFSNTFVQAWMRKVPVISMNSDPDCALTKGGVGILAPTEDELFHQTLRLLQDHELRIAMGERSYEYAAQHCLLEKLMPMLLQYIEGLK